MKTAEKQMKTDSIVKWRTRKREREKKIHALLQTSALVTIRIRCEIVDGSKMESVSSVLNETLCN